MIGNKVIFIIGVSGCGKSTIGTLLSEELDVPFFDGDDFHSDAKSRGHALDDSDRKIWLNSLNDLGKKQLKRNSCVIVCSALKNKYRELLSNGFKKQTVWVHLSGSYKLILNRISQRKNHFMDPNLLKSQFDILEKPTSVITCDIKHTPKEIIEKIKSALMEKSEFGLFGLGVMGKSLCRNLASKEFNLSFLDNGLYIVKTYNGIKIITKVISKLK